MVHSSQFMENNKLTEVFAWGKKNLLNIYCTAGYPFIDSTAKVIFALQDNGADMVEIGMPYSDPIADGPVIQESNMAALANGMNMHLLFEQLEAIKEKVHIPVILMGYFNPVLQFGVEKFCEAAERAGISGIIIPDLPMHEYEALYQPLFIKHNLSFNFLITPETDKKRLKKADRLSEGFIYAVSSSSVTGKTNTAFKEDHFDFIRRAKLKKPVMIGFGIRDKASFRHACRFANGAIIGSAYINALKKNNDIELVTREFIKDIIE